MKRIVAKFFATDEGTEPVKDWLISLGRDDRRTIGSDIATVEFGWPIGMPTCRPLRDGVREVRSSIKNGSVEARTYFGVDGGIMLLLHGEEGKDGQQDAIKLAIKRWKEHQERSKRLKKIDKGKKK
ncbi:type II toxin-antitoxin system RelE/ParE family toxin [Agrobacterium genomosp. 3]|uniref:Type II toxin-antitoxin system RelE/ParE family toxin n=1 Tax=Agrobacterium tumefaciens TaxID=358 RepID=A0AAE6BL70_AGRTU|nr:MULTISPECIES: type II toxin-antitoxin system RelE/ParE family toxin [Agrobacterium tumefaciens complex]MBP8938364.1 type II toxin-antitoxin system RelE/ParE family toxin [Agrobacterium sp.]MCA1868723.1 type II toxin-antitoxin system RelE/ParE family toxin [Agrobacterium tomkonis]MCA1879072.1 type II toxin-antitoxin system RelE/ParE family toxin [Agrobacterium tumefaciens]MCA1894299.1 type II toxin-antitoxin system RelE/ParE family toxin [Agrobacterium tomkonis]MCA2373757.1 type II toxin-ant